jgi:hypothetical protein
MSGSGDAVIAVVVAEKNGEERWSQATKGAFLSSSVSRADSYVSVGAANRIT